MTSQEYLDACAIAAMQSFIALDGPTKSLEIDSYDVAIRMLAERNKRMQAEAKPEPDCECRAEIIDLLRDISGSMHSFDPMKERILQTLINLKNTG